MINIILTYNLVINAMNFIFKISTAAIEYLIIKGLKFKGFILYYPPVFFSIHLVC